MKINRAKTNEFMPSFGEVRPGTVIQYRGDLYMKIWWSQLEVFRGRVEQVEGTHTAAHLGTGGLVGIPIDEKVKVVNGEYRC